MGKTFRHGMLPSANSLRAQKLPLLVLNDGPGMVHNNLLPLSNSAKNSGSSIILYNQLSNRHSTHLRATPPPPFWLIDHFISKLKILLSHLHISSEFDIFRHSWGGIFGMDYVLRRQPQNLRNIVLAHALASVSLWNQSTVQLMQAFLEEAQEVLMAQMADPLKYRIALDVYRTMHGCTPVKPVLAEAVASFDVTFSERGD
jgi:pimeloyl-ACP methyl ester carboxylesterase